MFPSPLVLDIVDAVSDAAGGGADAETVSAGNVIQGVFYIIYVDSNFIVSMMKWPKTQVPKKKKAINARVRHADGLIFFSWRHIDVFTLLLRRELRLQWLA